MILFDTIKRETHHLKANFGFLTRKLRAFGKIKNNKRKLSTDLFEECNLFVVGNPQEAFSADELQAIRNYISRGGSVIVFTSDGGESNSSSNLNELLKDYGIKIEDTSVVRSIYHKYHHPKHALITNGIVQPELGKEKSIPLDPNQAECTNERPQDDVSEPSMALSFVYPNGTTLAVQNPSYTLLSSGSTSYPVDCPIAAAYEGDRVNGMSGKLIVIGSVDIFSDDWVNKEENTELSEVLFRFLLHQNMSFDPSVGRADFEEKENVPCISSLANLVKSCILENEPLLYDYKSILIPDLFSMKMDYVTDVIDLHKQLNVPYEPLALIDPHFECPHPPLHMAAHKPRMTELSPPVLELFDIDDFLLDARTQSMKLVSKYTDDGELDLFVEELSLIAIPKVCNSDEWRINGIELPKYLMHHVAQEIFQFKIKYVMES